MEIQQRRIYPPEFKAEAVRLVLEQGYTNGRAARELGLPTKTLANWVRDARRSTAPPPEGAGDACGGDDPTALRARIRELERRLAQSETEKAILKKATAYFAKESL